MAPEAFDGAPDVTEAQAEEALPRLEEFGLIAGDRIETSDLAKCSRIGSTANGLRVLGESPPEESATLQHTLMAVLVSVEGIRTLNLLYGKQNVGEEPGHKLPAK
jgi:hypothetical protein